MRDANEPQALVETFDDDRFTQMEGDGQGRMVLTGASGRKTCDVTYDSILWSTTFDPTTGWGANRELSRVPGGIGAPRIAVGPEGQVVNLAMLNIYDPTFYALQFDAASGPATDTRLAKIPGGISYYDMSAAKDGHALALVYTPVRERTAETDVRRRIFGFSFRPGRGWSSAPAPLLGAGKVSVAGGSAFSVAAWPAPDGNLYALPFDHRAAEENWEPARLVRPPLSLEFESRVLVDMNASDEGVVAASFKAGELKTWRVSGGTFTERPSLPIPVHKSSWRAAIDNRGTVFVLSMPPSGPGLSVSTLRRDSESWETTDLDKDLVQNDLWYFSLAENNDHVVAAWSRRDNLLFRAAYRDVTTGTWPELDLPDVGGYGDAPSLNTTSRGTLVLKWEAGEATERRAMVRTSLHPIP